MRILSFLAAGAVTASLAILAACGDDAASSDGTGGGTTTVDGTGTPSSSGTGQTGGQTNTGGTGGTGGGQGGELFSGFTPTLFAAPTDLGTGDCSSEANACDLAQALSMVTAGGVVGILPGVYSGPANGNAPIFGVTSSGTEDAPIRIAAKYPALYNHTTPELLSDFRNDAPFIGDVNLCEDEWINNSPVYGVLAQDHVHTYGLYANQQYAPPRPSHGTFKIEDCTGCLFAEFVVDQIPTPECDNFNALFAPSTDGLIVRDALIRGGSGEPGINHNSCAITTYGTLDFLFEYLTFESVHCGIFIKGSANGNTRGNSGTIRYSKSTNAGRNFIEIAVVRAENEVGDNRIVITENLSVNDGEVAGGYSFGCIATGESCMYTDFTNNTSVAGASGGGWYFNSQVMEDMVFRDNVVAFTASNPGHPINLEGDGGATRFSELNYNLYYEEGQTPVYAQLGMTYQGIASWRNAVGGGREQQSTEESPSFDDAAAGNYYRTGTGDTGSSTGGIRGITVSPIGAPGT
jgi:hypothetical protein